VNYLGSLEPEDKSGLLFGVYGTALMLSVLLELLAMPVVPVALLVGGMLLRRRAEGRIDRVVGLAALTAGVLALIAAASIVAVYGSNYF
jgi:hypothetical protein